MTGRPIGPMQIKAKGQVSIDGSLVFFFRCEMGLLNQGSCTPICQPIQTLVPVKQLELWGLLNQKNARAARMGFLILLNL